MAYAKHLRTMVMHIPVLRGTISSLFPLYPGDIVVDATAGLGGHTELFASKVGKKGKVIAIEWDRKNLTVAKKRLLSHSNVIWVHENYKNIYSIIHNKGYIQHVRLIFFDLGVSSPHFDQADRGFSFSKEAKLDMRFDPQQSISAFDIINSFDERQLYSIFHNYGEEPLSFRIAKRVVEYRKTGIIQTTTELSDIIRSVVPKRLHVGLVITRIFQALRICVNDELTNLQKGLHDGFLALQPGGKMGVIAYHSLEDRIVKSFFKSISRSCICPKDAIVCTCPRIPQAHIITKRPITPSSEELKINRRSRSAKLRILQKN